MDNYLGEISVFGFNYAPRGWALCQGQLLPISQNTALFSLIGTAFGGDGRATFGLPNLQGMIANGQGQGPGLTPYVMGQTGGTASVTLTAAQGAIHSHGLPVSSVDGKQPAPLPSLTLGATGTRGEVINVYATPAQQSANPVTMLANTALPAGGGQPHNNMGPFVALNFCIALQGIYPPRP